MGRRQVIGEDRLLAAGSSLLRQDAGWSHIRAPACSLPPAILDSAWPQAGEPTSLPGPGLSVRISGAEKGGGTKLLSESLFLSNQLQINISEGSLKLAKSLVPLPLFWPKVVTEAMLFVNFSMKKLVIDLSLEKR